MGNRRTRITVSISASLAVVAAVAGTAVARIPEDDLSDGSTQAQPAVVALPDAVDRAVWVRTRTLEAKFADTDAVARAIARRSR